MKAKTIKLALDKLVVGLYVDLQLSWSEHPFTFSKLKIKDEKTLKIIQALPIDHVLVIPGRSDVEIPEDSDKMGDVSMAEVSAEISDEETTTESQNESEVESAQLHAKKKETENNYRKTAEQIQRMTADLKNQPANAIRDIDQIIMQMSIIFNDSSDMLTQMINLGSGEHSDQNHITNVTMLSLLLGKADGMSSEQLMLLGTAALLHDAGKIKVPLNIRNKPEPLTDAEEKIYQQHTYAGREMIERIKSMNVEVLNAIEQHHEFIDGSGYPKGLSGNQLSKIVRIIAVANLYDNLCNPAHSEVRNSPKIALALLYRQYRQKLDSKYVESLIKLLGVYPPGTVVRLSDNRIALVISGDSNAPMNPNVLLYDPQVAKSAAKMINLALYPSLNISCALNPGEYSDEIHHYLGLSERIGYMVESGLEIA